MQSFTVAPSPRQRPMGLRLLAWLPTWLLLSALRIQLQSQGSLWSRQPFVEGQFILLHSVSIPKSGNELVGLLSAKWHPYQEVYDRGCAYFMTESRLIELSTFIRDRFRTSSWHRTRAFERLLSPACLRRMPDWLAIYQVFSPSQYPLSLLNYRRRSVIGGKGDYDYLLIPKGLAKLEIQKLLGLPLADATGCSWLGALQYHLDVIAEDQVEALFWRLHPECLQSRNRAALRTISALVAGKRMETGSLAEASRMFFTLASLSLLIDEQPDKTPAERNLYAIFNAKLLLVVNEIMRFPDDRVSVLTAFHQVLQAHLDRHEPASWESTETAFLATLLEKAVSVCCEGVQDEAWHFHWLALVTRFLCQTCGHGTGDLLREVDLGGISPAGLWPWDLMMLQGCDAKGRQPSQALSQFQHKAIAVNQGYSRLALESIPLKKARIGLVGVRVPVLDPVAEARVLAVPLHARMRLIRASHGIIWQSREDKRIPWPGLRILVASLCYATDKAGMLVRLEQAESSQTGPKAPWSRGTLLALCLLYGWPCPATLYQSTHLASALASERVVRVTETSDALHAAEEDAEEIAGFIQACPSAFLVEAAELRHVLQPADL